MRKPQTVAERYLAERYGEQCDLVGCTQQNLLNRITTIELAKTANWQLLSWRKNFALSILSGCTRVLGLHGTFKLLVLYSSESSPIECHFQTQSSMILVVSTASFVSSRTSSSCQASSAKRQLCLNEFLLNSAKCQSFEPDKRAEEYGFDCCKRFVIFRNNLFCLSAKS